MSKERSVLLVNSLNKMTKLKMYAFVATASLLGLSVATKVFGMDASSSAAIASVLSNAASDASGGITSNLGVIIVPGIVIVVILVLWRLFRRFTAGR